MKERSEHRHRILKIMLCFCIATAVIGVSIAAYPFAAQSVSEKTVLASVRRIHSAAERVGGDERTKLLAAAQEYNQSLIRPTVESRRYLQTLNIDGNGAIGSISIPSLDLTLPIFHGVADTTLRKGVGHLERTAFPIGDVGTHAVLTSHSGLPEARLFSDIDKLALGYTFDITVLAETTRYKVVSVTVVTPSDVNRLTAAKDKCLVSLVTCTPIGVNSHRLVVTAEKIGVVSSACDTATDIETASIVETKAQPLPSALFTAVLTTLSTITASAVLIKHNRKRKE